MRGTGYHDADGKSAHPPIARPGTDPGEAPGHRRARLRAMGQGHLGGAIDNSTNLGSLSRYRVVAAFTLTALFVGVKAVGHDYWAVGFGLVTLLGVLLMPELPRETEPWRRHALRIVSACFVVVTLASIWTTLVSVGH